MCAYLYNCIAICFVLIFIGTRLYNNIGKHVVQHLFKTPMHLYFATVYPKFKTFKWIYNKNEEQKWIPNLFRERNIYLFQSNPHAMIFNIKSACKIPIAKPFMWVGIQAPVLCILCATFQLNNEFYKLSIYSLFKVEEHTYF